MTAKDNISIGLIMGDSLLECKDGAALSFRKLSNIVRAFSGGESA